MLRNILPMSQQEAVAFNPPEIDLPAIMIRIGSVNIARLMPLKHHNRFKAVLPIVFGDSTMAEWERGVIVGKLFTKADAQIIKNFVIDNGLESTILVVHCNAGMSRSPAVALAIAEWLELDHVTRMIAHSFNYFPNPHVLRVCRETFGTMKKLRDYYSDVFGKPTPFQPEV